jgi:hypothetical protein
MYDLMYDMGNGAFNVEVFTGIQVAAKNREQAIMKAEQFESKLSDSFDLSCCFKPFPTPHLVVTGFDTFHGVKTHPFVIGYKILRSADSPRKMLGFPVFSEEDFEKVSEVQFLKEMSEVYDKSTSFGSESYWIEKHQDSK